MPPSSTPPSNKSFVYIVKAGCTPRSPIKVGVSDDVKKRIKQLQTGNPKEIHLVMHFECIDRAHAFRLEKAIHEILKGQRLFGEWFSVRKTNVMKVLHKIGSTDEIESIVKNVGLFDRPDAIVNADALRIKKLEKTIESRDLEILDLHKARVAAKEKRLVYVGELLRLGLTNKDIGDLKKT